jgi:hypothetical protein
MNTTEQMEELAREISRITIMTYSQVYNILEGMRQKFGNRHIDILYNDMGTSTGGDFVRLYEKYEFALTVVENI